MGNTYVDMLRVFFSIFYNFTCLLSIYSSFPPIHNHCICTNLNILNSHSPISHDAYNNNNGSLKLLINERKLRKENKKYQEFFMSYNRIYNISHKMDISSLCSKRIVFISINGLFNTWRNIPPISLYNAIFILPLKQEWIQTPDKYKHEYSHLLEGT